MPSTPDTLVFTLCSNNYLCFAKLLADSMKRFEPDKLFVIGLVDRKRDDIDYAELGCPVIEIHEVEKDIDRYAARYSLVELNTFGKPAFFQYLFDRFSVDRIAFLDPDTCLYHRLLEMDRQLNHSAILLTPHILSPIPLDGKTPEESLFLNYGIYNFGFVALRRSSDSFRFLAWWKERTYERGFDNPAKGLFTDQIWGNLVPVFFDGVALLRHPGYNMALWNLHERMLTVSGDVYLVNENHPLVLYHFSGILGNPDRVLRDYSRFEGSDRTDLRVLYAEYHKKLTENLFFAFRSQKCYYSSFKPTPESNPSPHRPLLSRARQRVGKWMSS